MQENVHRCSVVPSIWQRSGLQRSTLPAAMLRAFRIPSRWRWRTGHGPARSCTDLSFGRERVLGHHYVGRLTPGALKAHLDERTAIIYLVDPNNPLGIRYTGE
jgi:hypothetical protein